MILADSLKKISFVLMCTTFLTQNNYAMEDDELTEDHKPGSQQGLNIASLFEEGESVQSEATSSLPAVAPKKKEFDRKEIIYAKDIHQRLSNYTIGQDAALKALAATFQTHSRAIKVREVTESDSATLSSSLQVKPNALLIGPTGCGKTSTLEVASKILGIPFAVVNATEWTPQGYIGGKWQQNVFHSLMRSAGQIMVAQGKRPSNLDIIHFAEKGIIFIDEIDKLCTRNFEDNDFFKRVQQELLPPIQGMELTLEDGTTINTSNILFIAGGAFVGLIPEDKNSKEVITPKKLEQYGMIPELAGRLNKVIQFSHLSKETLKQIILNSEHSILKQYQHDYKIAHGIDLMLAEGAIDHIAEMASQHKTGARAINSMIEKVMEPFEYDIQAYEDKCLLIDKETAVRALKDFREAAEKKDPWPPMMYS